MASQIGTTAELQVIEFQSYVRSYHAYMESWTPIARQALIFKRKPTNSHNVHAVAKYFDSYIVGHIPYNLAPKVSAFLRREVNKGFTEFSG